MDITGLFEPFWIQHSIRRGWGAKGRNTPVTPRASRMIRTNFVCMEFAAAFEEVGLDIADIYPDDLLEVVDDDLFEELQVCSTRSG